MPITWISAILLARLPQLMPQVTAVFHQGACSDTMESDGRYLMDNNFAYSKALMEACQVANVPFIYASSEAVELLNNDLFSLMNASKPKAAINIIDGIILWEC